MNRNIEVHLQFNKVIPEHQIIEIKNALQEINMANNVLINKPMTRGISGVEIAISFIISIAANASFKLIEPKIDMILKKYSKEDGLISKNITDLEE